MSSYRTALVTGASSGIGAAVARELAARGADLVLVARRADRLERLAGELTARHGVAVEVLAADLTDPEQLAQVEKRAAAGVELLVNNAGIGSAGRFASLPLPREDTEVRLNVLAVVRLTSAALPAMLARGHGGVLNVSSVAGFQPLPGGATYSASKAFVTTFSEAVAAEVGRRGVHVTALCPGFTHTEFHAGPVGVPRLPGWLWLSAEQVARAGVDGVEAGRQVVVPGAVWKLAALLGRQLPRPVIRAVTGRVRG